MPQHQMKFLPAHLPKNSMELTKEKHIDSLDEISNDLLNDNDKQK